MDDRSRLFLLSLAAVPACKDGVAKPTVEQACINLNEKYMSCYEGNDSGGYETGDYSVEDYCAMYESYFDEYGAGCEQAFADVWSCISKLDCAVLMDGDPDAACRTAYEDAYAVCPDLFGYCQILSVGGGPDSCSVGAQQCFDGKDYEVTCTPQEPMDEMMDPTNLDCECRVDDQATSTFTLEGSCNGLDLEAAAEEQCDFPDDVF